MLFFFKNGGPEVIRTPDLLGANEALYQLSYGPIWTRINYTPEASLFSAVRSKNNEFNNIFKINFREYSDI